MYNDNFLELDDITALIEIEEENMGCLHTALNEAEDNPKNYTMMIAEIITRLGVIRNVHIFAKLAG